KAAREDARAMADGLKRVGYAVTLRLDLSEREMKAAIRNFVGTIEGGDEVAFFFAGHGVQIGSANYLIPVDINGEGEAQIRDEAIALQRILDDFSDKKAKFTLAVIDACRDNPFKSGGRAIGSSSRGLAPTTAATGQMVIFSAGAGQRALDNLGDKDTSKNGVFTRVFVKEMQRRAVSIDKIVRDTRSEVVRLAKTVGHEQVPAIYDQVVGEFFFSQ
ncbi:MAG: caspase family protein, partial [Betaproteobacteria bacterium]|nr:caspase family protein [Betaproteobacteria bacterium]